MTKKMSVWERLCGLRPTSWEPLRRILRSPNLGTGWRWVVSFTPLPLYARGRGLRYPLDRRLDESPETFLALGEDKRSLLPRIEPEFSGLPTRSPTTVSLSTFCSLYFISIQTFRTRFTFPVLPIKLNFICCWIVPFLLFSLSRVRSVLLSCFLAAPVIN